MCQKPKFRQIDVTRALKGVRAAGLGIERVVIEDDRIVIVPGNPQAGSADKRDDDNDWDAALGTN
jgi:hypothetical protein